VAATAALADVGDRDQEVVRLDLGLGFALELATYVELGLVKLTGALGRVLAVFLADAAEPRYGYDLMRAARLSSGTLYPMLARLEDEGLVVSEWEPAGQEGGRPPRRYYRLTGEGVRVARLEVARAAQVAALRRSGAVSGVAPGPVSGFVRRMVAGFVLGLAS
jgi:DNA-binding PadR family transcriptional regulator